MSFHINSGSNRQGSIQGFQLGCVEGVHEMSEKFGVFKIFFRPREYVLRKKQLDVFAAWCEVLFCYLL